MTAGNKNVPDMKYLIENWILRKEYNWFFLKKKEGKKNNINTCNGIFCITNQKNIFEHMSGGRSTRKKKGEILLSSWNKFCLLSMGTHRKYRYSRGERAFTVTEVFAIKLTVKAFPIPTSTNCAVNWKWQESTFTLTIAHYENSSKAQGCLDLKKSQIVWQNIL